MDNLDIYNMCLYDDHLENVKALGYIPVGLGKENFRPEWLKDNEGKNISHKNLYYGEYSFYYWFWKNKLDLNIENWVGFCQKRRFWIKKNSENKNINHSNINDHLLERIPSDWADYDSILCEPIYVNNVKTMKLIKRGYKSILKDPSIFFNNNKQTLLLHFDMHHGYGNMQKAIELMHERDRNEFYEYLNKSCFYNPHIMFISKPEIINRWFNDLFTWLFKCEKIFGFDNLSGYDTGRLYAYLSERYLSFWFNEFYKVKSCPWIFFDTSK